MKPKLCSEMWKYIDKNWQEFSDIIQYYGCPFSAMSIYSLKHKQDVKIIKVLQGVKRGVLKTLSEELAKKSFKGWNKFNFVADENNWVIEKTRYEHIQELVKGFTEPMKKKFAVMEKSKKDAIIDDYIKRRSRV